MTLTTRDIIVSCNGVVVEPKFNSPLMSEPIYAKDFGLDEFKAGQEIKIAQKVKQTNQILIGFRRLEEDASSIKIWMPLHEKFQSIPGQYTFELGKEKEGLLGRKYPIMNTKRADIIERIDQWK